MDGKSSVVVGLLGVLNLLFSGGILFFLLKKNTKIQNKDDAPLPPPSSLPYPPGFIDDIQDKLQAIIDYSDKSKSKIQRFEEGYDLQLINKFLHKLLAVYDDMNGKNIKIYQDVDAFVQRISELPGVLPDDENVKKIKTRFTKEAKDLIEESIDDLRNLFKNNNIHKYDIKIGDDYKGKELFAEVKGTVQTYDPSKANTISEIIKDGFYYEISDSERRNIRNAEVNIYSMENGEQI